MRCSLLGVTSCCVRCKSTKRDWALMAFFCCRLCADADRDRTDARKSKMARLWNDVHEWVNVLIISTLILMEQKDLGLANIYINIKQARKTKRKSLPKR